MTEEAEQAAKWKMVEELKRDKEHIVVLKKQMKNIAERWVEFSRTMQSPDLHAFDVAASKITVRNWDSQPSQRPVADISELDTNWDLLVRLLSDYQKTQNNIKSLQSDLNLP